MHVDLSVCWHFDTNSRFLLDFSGVTIMFTVMMTLMWPHCVCFYLWGFRLDLARQWRCGCPLRERATIYTLPQNVQHSAIVHTLHHLKQYFSTLAKFLCCPEPKIFLKYHFLEYFFWVVFVNWCTQLNISFFWRRWLSALRTQVSIGHILQFPQFWILTL